MQVLSILDGSSASSWPGVSAALADLDALVSLTVRRMQQLDAGHAKLEAAQQGLQHKLSGAVTVSRQVHAYSTCCQGAATGGRRCTATGTGT